MSKSVSTRILVVIFLLLGGCAPYSPWLSSNYTFPANMKEGMLIMSITLDPKVKAYGAEAVRLGIEDITLATPDRIHHSPYEFYLGLNRSKSNPERFGLESSPWILSSTRDDIVVAKLPTGKYAIEYIRLNRGNIYWVHWFKEKYYFEISPKKAVYIGSLGIIVDEMINGENKMRIGAKTQDLSSEDLPLFFETMKQIPREAVVVDVVQARQAP